MTACLDRYSGLVWSLARRTLGAGPEAEDAVQEVFVELWRKADRFDPAKGKEATFIAVLTRRRLIDRLRRRRARPDGQPTPLTGDTPEPAAPAASADPVAPAELADELGRVHAAMGRLKPEQQRALRLAVCDG
ncbi:MAG: sigma-70 family RNA polymerase sigma factor, partial [Planctomycetota bacterium]